jgi:hypothetical protein
VTDVFEDVEEELRSERWRRWARLGLPILGGVLLLALIAALSWWGWQTWQTSKADKASEAYDRGMSFLRDNNADGAQAAFVEAAREGNGAYKAMALMQQAGIAVSANRNADAVRLFEEAAEAHRDPILADTARLRAAWLVMDTATLPQIQERLEPLTEEGRPYRAFAQHDLAMAQIRHGQAAAARATLVQLQLGQDVPDIIRQQAGATIEAIDSGAAANLARIVERQLQLPEPTAAPAAAPAGQAPAQAAAPAQP